ncbi:peptide chain release factor N(5)-glutamine methyltransferase [soil metagenome]
MKTDEYLSRSIAQLTAAGIQTARLDCLVLLEDVLNTNRTQIIAHPERKITEVQQKILDSMVIRRSRHIPLAYIRKKTEFYGREFDINSHVLQPRPESETMIELLKNYAEDAPQIIVDVGTGSGALAITAALELTGATVAACDVDSRCLSLAKQNAAKHRVNVTFYESDLLSSLPEAIVSKPASLLCNLPYVPDGFSINRAATHEPTLAIFGGTDGLDYYRLLFEQLITKHLGASYIFCESLPTQHKDLAQIAARAGFSQQHEQDLIQVFVHDS